MRRDHQVNEFRVEASAETHDQIECQEKPCRMLRNPYRKPTQVGG